MNEQASEQRAGQQAPRFQFSLWQMFVAFSVMGSFLGAYTWLGWEGILLWTFASWLFAFLWGILSGSFRLAVYTVGASVLILVLWPVQSAMTPARRSICIGNLSSLGKALDVYHQRHGCFPPAYMADENGQPMHSWRVLLLPHLDHKSVYDNYDFAEPWDGPGNSQFAAKIPFYQCPSDLSAAGATTNYLAVVGPGTAWPGTKSAKLSDFEDPSKTILLVEVVGENVPWMAPRDLDVGKLSLDINSKTATGISSRHPGGVNVLMADGHVEFIRNSTLPEELYELLMVRKARGSK